MRLRDHIKNINIYDPQASARFPSSSHVLLKTCSLPAVAAENMPSHFLCARLLEFSLILRFIICVAKIRGAFLAS
jgi:hypothetical protein